MSESPDQPELFGSSIYWLETSQAERRPCASSHRRFDVVIVGGGFTGLWTAYHLAQADPSMSIAVLERETIGFGASGRNGGFAMTLLDLSLHQLRENNGDVAAREAHEAVASSVEEIGDTIAREQIDCEWVRGGLMVVATNRAQLARIDSDIEAAEQLGLSGFKRLSAEEAQAEVHSPTYVGGLREEHCGVLHPAKLARGLASVVEAKGVTVFEATAVDDIEILADRVEVRTGNGAVLEADQVVLATNAWAHTDPRVGRKVLPLYTYIALTEPLDDRQWDDIGWASHCGIEDKRNFVHYYRRTLDGRILWGGSDGIVFPGRRIAASHDRNNGVFRRLLGTFRDTFPQLGDVRFTHHWGGPVGLTTRFVPVFGSVSGRLHYGAAYSGHGVAPSHTGGKILRDKVLGTAGDLAGLCFVDAREPSFPPEPIASIAAELSRRALRKQDDLAQQAKTDYQNEPLAMKVLRALE